LNPKLEYVIDMVESYGYALLNDGRAEEALAFEGIYEEFGDSADFQFLMGLIYMNNQRFEDAIAEFLKATQHTECRNVGVNSFAAFYNVGVICECLGRKEEAMDYYRKCGSYEPALRQLEEL
jgi:tetratricopeptide (TPR) repeat protein